MTALSFDDVLLRPQFSDIESRSEVLLYTQIGDKNKIWLDIPIIAAPMDTVCGSRMARLVGQQHGLGIIHRYNTINEQASEVLTATWGVDRTRVLVGAAVGAKDDYLERADAVINAGARVICIDTANGHHRLVANAIQELRNRYGANIHIMAGNVATYEGYDYLDAAGADSIRVGIGGGSCCTTRIVTGHGLPTLESLLDIKRNGRGNASVIADGGLRTSGDIVKALAAGADAVMLGSMLAGTPEAPGPTINGRKQFRGMASRDAQRAWRGYSSTPEGISTTVEVKPPVTELLEEIAGGIKSGLSYSGVRNIPDFQAVAVLVRQTGAGINESRPHAVEL